MNFIKILNVSVCLMVLLLTACGKSMPERPTADSEFRVSSTIHSLLRAPQLDESGAGKFLNGDENTIFIKNKTGEQITTFKYTYGTTYHWSDIRLSQEVKQCRVSACYPKVETTNYESFAWNINEHNGIDLLLASPVEASPASSTPINLSFKHALHKLSVALIPQGGSVSEDRLSQAVVTVTNVKPIAVVNLLTGNVLRADGSPIQLQKTGRNADFLIPAQEVGDIEVSIRLGDRSVSYRLATLNVHNQRLTSLESGKSFSLQVKVSNESFVIEGQHISGWQKQGEAEGAITL